MSRAIELANVEDIKEVQRLSLATWNNREPGFQIDGVQTVDDLNQVFATVRLAAPSRIARNKKFDSVFPTNPDFRLMSWNQNDAAGALHFDGPGMGLAVHQNITDIVPVMLGHPKGNVLIPFVGANSIENIREGETIPGRLTIFSQGGYGWLLQTAHQFARSNKSGNEWARYGQCSTRGMSAELIRKVATSALARISEIENSG